MLSALKLQSATAKDGKAKLDLGMSQGELALLIGASRPKVNIALTMLEDMGAITKAGSATPATSRSSKASPTWSDRLRRVAKSPPLQMKTVVSRPKT
jgi:predicted transcriptional regulator